jgi:hypothetical protein
VGPLVVVLMLEVAAWVVDYLQVLEHYLVADLSSTVRKKVLVLLASPDVQVLELLA